MVARQGSSSLCDAKTQGVYGGPYTASSRSRGARERRRRRRRTLVEARAILARCKRASRAGTTSFDSVFARPIRVPVQHLAIEAADMATAATATTATTTTTTKPEAMGWRHPSACSRQAGQGRQCSRLRLRRRLGQPIFGNIGGSTVWACAMSVTNAVGVRRPGKKKGTTRGAEGHRGRRRNVWPGVSACATGGEVHRVCPSAPD
jgi:hypothetical protein